MKRRSARTDSALARIAAVARKEIVDTLRDRRTMLVTLMPAIAAGPLFLVLILNLIARQADKARELDAAGRRAPSTRRRWSRSSSASR